MAKILIVEDSPTILAIIKETLEASGYSVITAVDGIEGLGLAQKESPDLVILDLMLPKMDGYKVCALLKKDAKHARIPIIMFTARSQESDKKMGQDLGANAYLTKPFEPELLLSKVKELLKEK